MVPEQRGCCSFYQHFIAVPVSDRPLEDFMVAKRKTLVVLPAQRRADHRAFDIQNTKNLLLASVCPIGDKGRSSSQSLSIVCCRDMAIMRVSN